MTQYTHNTRIWTPGGFIEDRWQQLLPGDALPQSGNFIVAAADYLAIDAATRSNNASRLGVSLLPGDVLEDLLSHLADIPLVALHFPSFADGRSYSKAACLRGGHGYKGTVRATGEILIDQVELMIRSGFDELQISHPVTLARLAEGQTGGVPYHTQPAQNSEAAENTYIWRRLPAA